MPINYKLFEISLRTKLNDWDGAAIYGNQLRSWARVDLYKGCTPPLGGACHSWCHGDSASVLLYFTLIYVVKGDGNGVWKLRSGYDRCQGFPKIMRVALNNCLGSSQKDEGYVTGTWVTFLWPLIFYNVRCYIPRGELATPRFQPPWGRQGFNSRIRPPYPQRVVKND